MRTSLRRIFSLGVVLIFTVQYSSIAQTITSTSTGGNWENAATWIGGIVPTENNDVVINGTVSITGAPKCRNVTINAGQVLQSGGSLGWVDPDFKGNVTNNGVVRNRPAGNALWMEVYGNITNNGIWSCSGTYLPGQRKQYLSQAAGKFFETEFRKGNSSGITDTNEVVASSALTFKNAFNLQASLAVGGYWQGRLNMAGNSLTLAGSANIYNGTVVNATNIYVQDNVVFAVITYSGTTTLHGTVSLAYSVVFTGDVTILDTLQSGGSYTYPYTSFKGNVTNNGVVRNRPGGIALRMEVYGNITNNGIWSCSYTYVYTYGKDRTINGRFQTYLTIQKNGTPAAGSVYVGTRLDNYATIEIGNGTILNVQFGAVLNDYGTIIGGGRLVNNGLVSAHRKITVTQDYSSYEAVCRILAGSGIDTLVIQTNGYQVPETFSNALKAWWRLVPSPSTASNVPMSYLRMYYDDAMLGSNSESQLQVYWSADTGKTWKQLSTTGNTTRNANDNWVQIIDVPANGSYVLSSSPNPVSVRRSVIVSLLGRTQIRVGPPNQYTVQYVNNSDVETGDMLLQLGGTGGVHIRSVTPSPQPGYTSKAIPVDSLTYDGDDTSVLLWVMSMAPREERTFSLIATATPGLGKSSMTAESITLNVIVVFIGVGLIEEYVSDAIVNGTEAFFATKVSNGDMRAAANRAINGTCQKTKVAGELREAPAKKVFGEVAEKLAEHFIGVVLWPLKLGKVILVDCVGAAIRGAKRYVGGDAVDQAEAFMEEGTKPLQKVTSWDPNEKIAPDGYGTERFLSTIGRMNYQILFENKKEATAPAYTIVVVDTLQADFDSTSVVFEKTSHDGPAYNWQMTKNGNILKWRIDAIELPPNVNPPEGEGYVTFSVKPKSAAVSGTILKNTGTITFDINAPIRTNQVMNTLDLAPPTTVMKPIPQKLTSNTIVVKWQATDGTGGSGVASATVFASKDGGPFVSVGTSSTDSLVFTPSSGSHKYTFYALAKDNVGNVESVRPALVTSDIVNDVEEKITVPTEFSLYQNYPNPFNPTTEIVFSVSVAVKATLRIYDMLGREIATLVDEVKSPGRYTVRWDAGKNASGVYFYRLIAGDFVQTRRLVFIK